MLALPAREAPMLKVASFNVENLFARAKALNFKDWKDGKRVLELHQSLNTVFQKTTYTAADRKKIVAGLTELGLRKSDSGEFVVLRQNRGRLVRRRKTGPMEVVATGRHDWVGWLDLKVEEVNETSTRMIAQVLRDVGAHVVGVVEAENRPSLKRFNDNVLPAVQARPYEHVMVIDGNDDRGIDVGLLARAPVDIASMLSHVDDAAANGSTIFSRDCPEYRLRCGNGDEVLVLINHLKSKGYGGEADSNARRRLQAERLRAIYDQRRADGVANVVILGDFNDTPDSEPLSPILQKNSDLKDVSQHGAYTDDANRPGTYANGTASGKLDYILLSPALFAKVLRAGVFRRGVWAGTNGTIWPHYPEMTQASHAASDHSALWVELDIG
jgi:endonuclease/exonuclease/phosphatase family metal-dependent hydrolase